MKYLIAKNVRDNNCECYTNELYQQIEESLKRKERVERNISEVERAEDVRKLRNNTIKDLLKAKTLEVLDKVFGFVIKFINTIGTNVENCIIAERVDKCQLQ